MKSKLNLVINTAGAVMVAVGVAVVIYAVHVRNTTAAIEAQPPVTALNSATPPIEAANAIQGEPIELIIPSLGIKNQIIGGVFDTRTRQWTLTRDKVQYALITLQPNDQRGLTFMYGHNRREVFARLPVIQTGAIAQVGTKNGFIFTYRFKSSRVTSPEDTAVFSYDGPPILVLQTCTGSFFQNRQLFTFEFVGVSHV